jgi:hypothetical protein
MKDARKEAFLKIQIDWLQARLNKSLPIDEINRPYLVKLLADLKSELNEAASNI